MVKGNGVGRGHREGDVEHSFAGGGFGTQPQDAVALLAVGGGNQLCATTKIHQSCYVGPPFLFLQQRRPIAGGPGGRGGLVRVQGIRRISAILFLFVQI